MVMTAELPLLGGRHRVGRCFVVISPSTLSATPGGGKACDPPAVEEQHQSWSNGPKAKCMKLESEPRKCDSQEEGTGGKWKERGSRILEQTGGGGAEGPGAWCRSWCVCAVYVRQGREGV